MDSLQTSAPSSVARKSKQPFCARYSGFLRFNSGRPSHLSLFPEPLFSVILPIVTCSYHGMRGSQGCTVAAQQCCYLARIPKTGFNTRASDAAASQPAEVAAGAESQPAQSCNRRVVMQPVA